MKFRYILSLSGGKDSVALLLYLIEEQKKKEPRYPLDEVLSCYMDNWEYNSIKPVIEQCRALCELNNIKFTQFILDMDSRFEKYSWCGGACRYGTSLKVQTMQRYYKETYPDTMIVEYIGYAKKEEKRINRFFENSVKIYPLIENGISENDALVMCFKNHIHWIEDNKELYDYIDRVSCKYCKNKNLKELEAIQKDFPNYWEDLKNKQDQTNRQYKKDYSFTELENKFEEKKEFSLFSLDE